MSSIKLGIRKIFHSLGLEVHRLSPQSDPAFQLLKSLERFNIDLVFDVGANVGQFGSGLREFGFKGDLISFEPLSSAYNKLCNISKRDAKWRVHQRAAIGNYDGEIEINISNNSVSSSVLPMMEAHTSAALNSAYVGTEKVPIFRLDSVGLEYLTAFSRPFLKIDTQGIEWQVLDGASEILKHTQGVLCELSLVPLYEGQHLWMDMIHRLKSEGFTLWSIQKGFTDPRDGRTLQVDATFFRLDKDDS